MYQILPVTSMNRSIHHLNPTRPGLLSGLGDYYSFSLMRVFHSCVSWWIFIGVWVTVSLQDSSQYFGWSQQYCSLNGPHISSYFQDLQSPYQNFDDWTGRTSYSRYRRHLHVPSLFVFFSPLAKSRYLSFFLLSFCFTLRSTETAESIIWQVLFLLLLTITKSVRLTEIRWSVYIWKSQRILYVSFFSTESGLSIYHLFVWSKLNFLPNFQRVLSYTIFTLIYCIRLLCCSALHIRWYSVSLLRHPFLSRF